MLGLLDPTGFSSGVDGVRFRATVENVDVVDVSFTQGWELCSFFDNQAVNLGTYAGLAGALDVKLTLDVTASKPGAEFSAQLILGDTALAAPLAPSADFNNSGVVSAADLAIFKTNFGLICATHEQGDANYDGLVDGADLLIWQRQKTANAPATAAGGAVPEPATTVGALALVGGLVAGVRRGFCRRRLR